MNESLPRVLLLQIRDQADAEAHECQCFVESSGLPAVAFSCHNLVQRPGLSWEDVSNFDILLIGGAGAHSATREHPFTEPLGEVVRRWVGEDRPLLGSCWGHQFLARLYGGEVICDPLQGEVGTFDVRLTHVGREDPLLAESPARFAVQLGHHDTVTTLPPGFVELGYSERCRNQIVRFGESLVYGTQFHCELDEKRLYERLEMYRQRYLSGQTMESIPVRPSPQPPLVLRRFVELCLKRRTPPPAASGVPPIVHATTRRMRKPGTDGDSLATWHLSAADGLAPDRRLEANLIVIWHPDKEALGRRYRLAPGSTLEIGRSIQCEIALRNVLSVSRRHARLSYAADSVLLEDLDSTNKTYLNDLLVERPVPLSSGDRFQVGAVHFKFLRERDPEHAYHRAIYQLVTHDGLTEIFNKRKFSEESEREFVRARRYGRSLALVLFDIDHFKRVNDVYGHLCGDYVLKRIATLCRQELRPEQTFARVGGEEFAVLCPETDLQGAQRLAERLRGLIAASSFRFAGVDVETTCSFGVALQQLEMRSFDDLFEATDRALYASKAAGRDRVTVVPDPPPAQDREAKNKERAPGHGAP